MRASIEPAHENGQRGVGRGPWCCYRLRARPRRGPFAIGARERSFGTPVASRASTTPAENARAASRTQIPASITPSNGVIWKPPCRSEQPWSGARPVPHLEIPANLPSSSQGRQAPWAPANTLLGTSSRAAFRLLRSPAHQAWWAGRARGVALDRPSPGTIPHSEITAVCSNSSSPQARSRLDGPKAAATHLRKQAYLSDGRRRASGRGRQ